MGKMLISKGVVLLNAETEETGNIYSIEAAKGIDAGFINTFVEITFPKIPVFKKSDLTGSSEFVDSAGLYYFFKIYFQNKYLGLLCFGKKLNNSELAKHEIVFIETMLNISASAIENTIKFTEVTNLNASLNNKIHQLKSLFELGKEFNSNFINKEKIIKLLSYTLLGNFGIKDFIILSRHKNDDFYLVKENKNLDLSGFDLKELFPKGKIPEEFKATMIINNYCSIPFIKYLSEKGFELLVPTIIDKEVDSIICLGKKLNNLPYTDADIEFLESIINLSLISIQNSILFKEYLDKQKIENELKIAREIQLTLLPTKIPEINKYDLAGINLPALQVGGDYYDIIKLTETKTALVIADVSGKGTPAALLMANIQSAVHSYLKLYEVDSFDLAKVTEKINELIYENTSAEKFITFFWGILDSESDTFEYINAGHNPPIHLSGNKISQLTEGGFMIGILDFGINYEVGKITLAPNDTIVFYTDGVTEAMNKNGDEFGEEKLTEILLANKDRPAINILEDIEESIVHFSRDTAQYDDVTLIVMKKI